MSTHALDARFPDEDACWRHLEAARWPDGVVCPACRAVGSSAPWAPRPRRWQCGRCGAQFRATHGTPLQGTHLSLRTWFHAAHLVLGLPYEVSSLTLARELGVTRKTALRVAAALRRLEAEHGDLARGIVTGGRPGGRRARRPGRRPSGATAAATAAGRSG